MKETPNLTSAIPRSLLYSLLLKYADTFAPVVTFNKADNSVLKMDFTAANSSLTDEVISNTSLFTQYIEQQLQGYTYGVGGYNELRTVYARSQVFSTSDEPRRLHLGVDIWGPEGTQVYAPIDGTVHSFAFNDSYGDYGATIILQHQLDGFSFYTLYGHLSLNDIAGMKEGLYINQGQPFAHFGIPQENGHWPPHLHFQVIENMYEMKGDYPGVCKASESGMYLANSPDADLVLQLLQYAKM